MSVRLKLGRSQVRLPETTQNARFAGGAGRRSPSVLSIVVATGISQRVKRAEQNLIWRGVTGVGVGI
jgi:hypothetical protein